MGMLLAVLIRRVRSIEELGVLFDVVAAQFEPPLPRDRRFDEVVDRWESAQRMSFCIVEGDAIVGGVLAMAFDQVVTIRAIAVPESDRGLGVGRRLVELVELEAMDGPCLMLALGSVDDARGFYDKLGFRGRHSGRSKDLPPLGRLRDRRVASLRAALGDLDSGVAAGAPIEHTEPRAESSP